MKKSVLIRLAILLAVIAAAVLIGSYLSKTLWNAI